MAITVRGNGILMPSPVSITSNGELIWSENTGRGANGDLLGDVLSEKQTYDISWGILNEREFQTLCSALPSGFFPFQLGQTPAITVYRGTLKGEILGGVGDGNTYYKDVSVSVIQK